MAGFVGGRGRENGSVESSAGIVSSRVHLAKPAYCERIIGSVRRECLDHVIVFSETHLEQGLALGDHGLLWQQSWRHYLICLDDAVCAEIILFAAQLDES